ncbi:hypothetical protein KEM56_007180 [Ascosphaera pollenicola]|nr:hypothetical protein KEM56_007180 [Ascosphaera pollenicola]
MPKQSKFIERFGAPKAQSLAIQSEFWDDLAVLNRRKVKQPRPIIEGSLAGIEANGNTDQDSVYQEPVNGFPAPPLDFSHMMLPERKVEEKPKSKFSRMLHRTGLRHLSGSAINSRDAKERKDARERRSSHPYGNSSNNFTSTTSGSDSTPASSTPEGMPPESAKPAPRDNQTAPLTPGEAPTTPTIPAPPENQIVTNAKRKISLRRRTTDLIRGSFRDKKRAPDEVAPVNTSQPHNANSSSQLGSVPEGIDNSGQPTDSSSKGPTLSREARRAMVKLDGKVVFKRSNPSLDKFPTFPTTPPTDAGAGAHGSQGEQLQIEQPHETREEENTETPSKDTMNG